MQDANQQNTNAALAALASAGDSFALGQLWEINKHLLRTLFWKWYPPHKEIADAHGLTADDFEQEAFFAVQYAAQTYDPAQGAFTTWLAYSMRRQIQLALCNGHRRRVVDADGKSHTVSSNPLDNCISLDLPADESNPDSSTLCDLQPDPAAQQAFTDAETHLYNAELRAVLDDALTRCAPADADAVRCRFYDSLSLEKAGNALGLTPAQVRTAEGRALRKLRADPRLKQWHDAELATRAWHGTGFSAWESGGSVEEHVVEWLEKPKFIKSSQNSEKPLKSENYE